VPSLLEAIPVQVSFTNPLPDVLSVQVPPESVDVQILPPVPEKLLDAAASFVPSLLEAIASHMSFPLPTGLSVHVPPESVDVQMLPHLTAAASFVPSLLMVTAVQSCTPGPAGAGGSGGGILGPGVSGVHCQYHWLWRSHV